MGDTFSDGDITGGLVISGEACPIDHRTGELTEEHKHNLQHILRKTDAMAENEHTRRDCIKIQNVVQKLRNRYGVPE